jgi:hypothetical protein
MRAHRLTAFAFIILACLIAPAFADGNFIKIGGIKGAATEYDHRGWIEIGNWETVIDRGFHILGSAKSQFRFETADAASVAALRKAEQSKAFYDTVWFDVSIKGVVLRTTLYAVRVSGVESAGKIQKVTLLFKKQTDQRVTFSPQH